MLFIWILFVVQSRTKLRVHVGPPGRLISYVGLDPRVSPALGGLHCGAILVQSLRDAVWQSTEATVVGGRLFGMCRWAWVALLVFGMGCVGLTAQAGLKTGAEPCDQAVRRSAAAVLQAQKDLVGQPVKDMDTEVPPALRVKIAGFKDTLVAGVDAVMDCEAANATAEKLQKDLVGQFHANQPVASKIDWHYGANLQVKVTAPVAQTSLRIVELSFDIECGGDTILLAYELARRNSQVISVAGAHVDSGTPDGLGRVLRWQAAPYEEINGAFGDFFEYVVLPAQDGKPWRLAVAHGEPWCTSTMSGLNLDLIEPEPGGAHVVWSTKQIYRRGDSSPRLVLRPNGFELRADVFTIEMEQIVRKGVFRYVVDGDTVRRVGPIAVDGRGFVDEWLQLPWSEAKQWSVAEGSEGFEKAHEAFARGRKDASVTYSYGPVRACLMKGQYEVEIDAEPGGKQFYDIREGPNGYTMVNFGTTQDERCSGPDLMKKK